LYISGLKPQGQKITAGEMRQMGIRGLLLYCADYKCSHSVTMTADCGSLLSQRWTWPSVCCLTFLCFLPKVRRPRLEETRW